MLKFENHSNGRFYYLSLSRDLLQDHILSVIRGGPNKHVSAIIATGSAEALSQKIISITKRRLSRGYTLVKN